MQVESGTLHISQHCETLLETCWFSMVLGIVADALSVVIDWPISIWQMLVRSHFGLERILRDNSVETHPRCLLLLAEFRKEGNTIDSFAMFPHRHANYSEIEANMTDVLAFRIYSIEKKRRIVNAEWTKKWELNRTNRWMMELDSGDELLIEQNVFHFFRGLYTDVPF